MGLGSEMGEKVDFHLLDEEEEEEEEDEEEETSQLPPDLRPRDPEREREKQDKCDL